MTIQWHHTNLQMIAKAERGPVKNGRMRVPNKGPGHYHFGVDHRPHNNNMGTYFSSPVKVEVYGPGDRLLGNARVHHDKYNDKNVAVWDVRNAGNVDYFVV